MWRLLLFYRAAGIDSRRLWGESDAYFCVLKQRHRRSTPRAYWVLQPCGCRTSLMPASIWTMMLDLPT